MPEKTDVEYVSGLAGEKISGWLYLPAANGPVPGIVWCPGFTGTKKVAFYQPYIEKLVGAGYAVLLSDYRGWGDSDGPRGIIDPRMQTDDIRAGITYLETRKEVDPQRVGVVGNSYGGGHATYVNAVDDRVRASVAISATADGKDMFRRARRGYEYYEFVDALAEERRRVVTGGAPKVVNPNEDISIQTPERRQTKVKGDVPMTNPATTPLLCAQTMMDYSPARFAAETRRMLWIAREEDPTVPWQEASGRMYDLAQEPKGLVILAGRGHYSFYLDQFDAIWAAMEPWLAEHLAKRGQVVVQR